jgi:hypothetical protein
VHRPTPVSPQLQKVRDKEEQEEESKTSSLLSCGKTTKSVDLWVIQQVSSQVCRRNSS